MASYKNFQSVSQKHSTKESRVNQFNSAFYNPIDVSGKKQVNSFENNIDKWKKVIAYYKWYPDLWWDLLRDKENGIRLDLDQRVFMRALSRFPRNFFTFARGYSKTFLQIMQLIHTAVFYPRVQLSVTAQTRQNSAKLLKDKYNEIVTWFPLVKEEIFKTSFQSESARIEFHNGSVIDNLSNSFNSNGMRRNRGSIEEAFLIDQRVFLEAVEPIFNVPRMVNPAKKILDYYELNGSINFFTSAGYRGSEAYNRCVKMYKNMLDLSGDFVLGASWEMAYVYGRGENANSIYKKKKSNTPTDFNMNYMARWAGTSTDAFVDSKDLINCRNLKEAEYKGVDGGEYVLGVDVARSKDSSNNQTSIAVIKIIRINGRIKSLNLVNLVTLAGTFNTTAQSIEIKRMKKRYNATMVIVDENGLGVGLVDELVKCHIDPETNEDLGCWNTITDDGRIPEIPNAERCLFGIFAQSYMTSIIVTFRDLVASNMFRLLERKEDVDYDINNTEEYVKKMLPYKQTDALMEEFINMKIKDQNNGKLTLERLEKSVDKDRLSSVIYAVWYIMKNMQETQTHSESDDWDYLFSYANL